MFNINITEKICAPLSQRYLLACMCMVGYALITINQLTFTLFIKEMLYSAKAIKKHSDCPSQSNSDKDKETVGMEEFMWGTHMQLVITSGWVVGNFLGRLPAGLAIERFGAKTIFGYSVFVPAICNILTPLCSRTSPYAILANRIIMGMFSSSVFPAQAWLAARWFPPQELGFMLSIMLAGFPLGSIVRYSLSYVTVYVSNSWVTLYYVSGVISLIWSYLWQAIIHDDPFDHPYISVRELEMLADKIPMYANDTELEPGWNWPWKSFLKSSSLWSLSMGHLGYDWVYNFAVGLIPMMYFPEVHHVFVAATAWLASVLYLVLALTMIAAGKIADTLIIRKIFNITHVCKTYYSISTILGSIMFLGLTHSSCNMTTIYIYYLAGITLMAVAFTSHLHACINMAPNFAATIVSLTSMPGLIGTPLQVLLQDQLTKKGLLKEWKLVSYLSATVCIFATALFLKVGRCTLRPWNNPKGKKTRDIDYESFERFRPKPSSSNLDQNKLTENPTDDEDSKMQEHPAQLKQSESKRRVSQIKSSRSLNRMKKLTPSAIGDVEYQPQTPGSKMETVDSKASGRSPERVIPQDEEGK